MAKGCIFFLLMKTFISYFCNPQKSSASWTYTVILRSLKIFSLKKRFNYFFFNISENLLKNKWAKTVIWKNCTFHLIVPVLVNIFQNSQDWNNCRDWYESDKSGVSASADTAVFLLLQIQLPKRFKLLIKRLLRKVVIGQIKKFKKGFYSN